MALAVIAVAALVAAAVKILPEYERGVILRLGRIQPLKGPGLIFIIPVIDRLIRVNLRTQTYDIPPQDIITEDNVTVRVNAVVYFNVVEAVRSVLSIDDYRFGTQQVAQTTLAVSSVRLRSTTSSAARRDQPAPPAGDRPGHRPVGGQGDPGRGQGRHPPRHDAPGDGPAGGGRA